MGGLLNYIKKIADGPNKKQQLGRSYLAVGNKPLVISPFLVVIAAYNI